MRISATTMAGNRQRALRRVSTMNMKLVNVAAVLVIVVLALVIVKMLLIPTYTQVGENIEAGVEAVDQIKQNTESSTIINLVQNDVRIRKILDFPPAGYHDVTYEVEYAVNGSYAVVHMSYLAYDNSQDLMEVSINNQDGTFTIGPMVTSNVYGTLTLDELASKHTQ